VAAAKVSNPPKSTSAKPSPRLDVGAVVAERYRLLKLLGEGSAGTVYAAEHVLLKKKVAIKLLHPELTGTPESVARFEREAMATARIEHPNVACAVDFGRHSDGSMYLALEYVEGISLRDVIAKGPLGTQRALHIARQIASALAAAQALDIVHRDLKPENVMLVSKGGDSDFVKVLDFGIARVPVDESPMGGPQALTKAGAVFGTAEYMPPEQGIGQKVDTRADLYALGVMMFEMIAGVRPYSVKAELGILAQQITLPIPTFAERAPGIDVPQPLERLVCRLLAKRPQERMQRADDVIRAIDNVAEGKPIASVAPGPVSHTEEPLPAFALTMQFPGVAPPVEKPKSVRPLASVSKATASLSRSVRQSFSQISALIDARRQTWPEPFRGWLIRVPAGLLVVLAIGLVLFLVGNIGVWLHHSQASRASAATSASAASAAQAVASAASSTGQAVPHPDSAAGRGTSVESDTKDTDALLDVAQSKLREGREQEAITSVARILGRHPDRRNDARVANMLFKGATIPAKGVSNTAFSLLEGVMAAPGAEIMYQLAIDRSLPGYVRSRAEKWLHSPQFDRAASDALRVAAKIRFAPTCESKHALLPTAGKAGGSAALAYLQELRGEAGCGLSGKSDCYTCLRGDHELTDTIARIEARLKQ
jgi:serine/threonine-protein kinase